jgi:hypothetical protein
MAFVTPATVIFTPIGPGVQGQYSRVPQAVTLVRPSIRPSQPKHITNGGKMSTFVVPATANEIIRLKGETREVLFKFHDPF